MNVKARCYKCGIVEFTVPAGTDLRRLICNVCFDRIKQKQDLNAGANYKLPYWKVEEK